MSRRHRRTEAGAHRPHGAPTPITHELGPAVPLDGVSPEDREAERNARLLQALRDGVPLDAVAERFAMERARVHAIASRAGVSTAGTWWMPYGVPV